MSEAASSPVGEGGAGRGGDDVCLEGTTSPDAAIEACGAAFRPTLGTEIEARLFGKAGQKEGRGRGPISGSSQRDLPDVPSLGSPR